MKYEFSAKITIKATSLREAREKMDELEDCHRIGWTILPPCVRDDTETTYARCPQCKRVFIDNWPGYGSMNCPICRTVAVRRGLKNPDGKPKRFDKPRKIC